MVEPAQVRQRHLDVGDRARFGWRHGTAARRGLGERTGPLDDRLGAGEGLALTRLDGPGHAGQGVLAQQLQDPHEAA